MRSLEFALASGLAIVRTGVGAASSPPHSSAAIIAATTINLSLSRSQYSARATTAWDWSRAGVDLRVGEGGEWTPPNKVHPQLPERTAIMVQPRLHANGPISGGSGSRRRVDT